MDVDVIVPGHGPIGGKKELAEMGQYLELFKREARKRFDAGLRPGQAAAQISLGKFDNWIGARDRPVMNTVRLYHELMERWPGFFGRASIPTSRLIGFVGPEY
jgi:hypothetical protein